MKILISFVLSMVMTFWCAFSACGSPEIKISHVTPYPQSEGKIEGTVKGVDPSLYKVAVYIKVGDSWWTKPAFSSPLTTIDGAGYWKCQIDTGEHDRFATAVKALLVPLAIDPVTIRCGPCCDVPDFSQALASAAVKRSGSPKLRKIDFAGRTWAVKRTDFPYGPGPNYFADSAKNIWVDREGLHLTVKRTASVWVCSEVFLSESLGYGTYIFQTNSRVDRLNEQVVLGLFTYDATDCANSRELDIEFAKWSKPDNPTNAQYVVQPCFVCPGCGGNCTRFKVKLSSKDKRLTHFMIWLQGRVEFRTYRGHWSEPFPSDAYLVKRWVYDEPKDVPNPGNEKVRLNLWLLDGQAPSDGRAAHAVISWFFWLPPDGFQKLE